MTGPDRRRAMARPPSATIASLGVSLLASLCLVAAACTPKKDTVVPETFEITGKSTVDGQTLVTARDTGTGCEIIVTPYGVMPRNERSADGLSVKQRCVLTGTEQVSVPTTTVLPPDPAQTSVLDKQASAVADAVREATLPPPTVRNIPPPTGGGTKPRAVPPVRRPVPALTETPDGAGDGVESQLKK